MPVLFAHHAVGRLRFAVLAPLVLLSQHLVVALAFAATSTRLVPDLGFWLLPLRRFVQLPLPDWAPVAAFLFSLIVAGGLALLSFGRARRSGWGYALAALSIVPALQIVAVIALAVLPVRASAVATEGRAGRNAWHVVQGVLSGIAIIVLAVLISAIGFGSYGWGLFIATPFLVGVTTAYLANRETALPEGQTIPVVLSAAALGTLALVMLALEGLACIIIASPLGALAAIMGGALGRALALSRSERSRPLMSIALLPAVFAFEAAKPPMLPMSTAHTIEIAASPLAVWDALTRSGPVAQPPGLTALAGLAYPVGSRVLGQHVGGERIGVFSTGTARERITAWQPGRRLAVAVLSQPPAMDEFSPYQHVHAPHVDGYFETVSTSFELAPLPNGATLLTIRAAHVLRIDPVLYWQPIAKWAIADNVGRVLTDIKLRAEAGTDPR